MLIKTLIIKAFGALILVANLYFYRVEFKKQKAI